MGKVSYRTNSYDKVLVTFYFVGSTQALNDISNLLINIPLPWILSIQADFL